MFSLFLQNYRTAVVSFMIGVFALVLFLFPVGVFSASLDLITPENQYVISWQDDAGQSPTNLPAAQILFDWEPVDNPDFSYYAVAVGNAPGAITGVTPGAGWYTTGQESELLLTLPENGSDFYVRLFAYNENNQEIAPNQIYRFRSFDAASLPTTEPEPEPTPLPRPNPDGAAIARIWANSGEQKVPQEQTPAVDGESVLSHVWNGEQITLFAAKNEIVGANVLLESGEEPVLDVQVRLNQLVGQNGFKISGNPTPANDIENGLFNWQQKDIELFFVRYLPILGVSTLGYDQYDQRHAPAMMRRPYDARGVGIGYRWIDRPHYNQSYPDIAVPIELEQGFSISVGEHQSIWMDVYVPKNAPAGEYTGMLEVQDATGSYQEVPVVLNVADFSLPDEPSAKSMIFISAESTDQGGSPGQIERRYGYSNETLRNNHFLLAHRHKVSLIDHGWAYDAGVVLDRPSDEWIPRLDGTLFSADSGYRGPGEQIGNGVFSVATYGGFPWLWNDDRSQEANVFDRVSQQEFQRHSRAFEAWFEENAPDTDRFVYLIDEPGSSWYDDIEKWSRWSTDANGLDTLSTIGMQSGRSQVPSLSIAPTLATFMEQSDSQDAQYYQDTNERQLYFYNGKRPGAGSFMIEDEGFSVRANPWIQVKHDIDRWFYWEGTYYKNYDGSNVEQGNAPDTNVFSRAHTFGHQTQYDNSDTVEGGRGETGASQYAPIGNGDGVLFYPGTDVLYPQESYGVNGPFASLRLKHWRRGIQDADYIALAKQVDLEAATAILEQMIPAALWEVGVAEPGANWQYGDISWSIDANDWNSARRQLAAIIEGDQQNPPASPVSPQEEDISSESLIAAFSFSGTVDDEIANIETNSSNITYGDGVDGQAGSFDSGSFISLTNSPLVNIGIQNQRTVSFFFRPNDFSGTQLLYEEGGTVRGLSIYLEDNILYAAGWNTPQNESGWQPSVLSAVLPDNDVWYHVALTLDGQQSMTEDAMKLYLNGDLIGSALGSQLWSHSGGIGIGAVNGDTVLHTGNATTHRGLSYRGLIDEFRIYNRPVNDQEASILAARHGAVLPRKILTYNDDLIAFLLDGNTQNMPQKMSLLVHILLNHLKYNTFL